MDVEQNTKHQPKTREELDAITQHLISSMNTDLQKALHVTQAELDRMCIGDCEKILEENGGFKITAPRGNRYTSGYREPFLTFRSKEELMNRRKEVTKWLNQ